MDFLTLAKDRFSCRKFADKPVEGEKIDKIIEAGLAAPTACNNQPVKIFVIKTEEALKKAAETTAFTFGAPVIFAVGADKNEAWTRGSDGKNFADVDASIVASHMMLEIHDLGLGATWVASFDTNKFADFFPETAGYNIIALFPTGYPAEDAVPAKKHFISKSVEEMVTTL